MPKFNFYNEQMKRVTSASYDSLEEAVEMAKSWNKDHRSFPTQIWMVAEKNNNGNSHALDLVSSR